MKDELSYLISVSIKTRQEHKAKITLAGFIEGIAKIASLLIFETLCSRLIIKL